ncbi:MAG: hypothetical protein WA584_12700 [Pyrinomonadaceae bacterium]
MTIKDFGARVESVWEGLRPVTKKMIVRALQEKSGNVLPAPTQKFSYDAHADWELSRLLSALDEQAKNAEVKANSEKLGEIRKLAETCASVLESKTESAEVFIQLTTRAVQRNDFNKIDRLADILDERFSATEIAEVIRQTELAQIRAIAFETLAMMPVSAILPLLDDSIYFEIARNAIEQQAFEFESEEAREILDQMEFDELN